MRHISKQLITRLMALAMAAMLLVCSVPAVSAAEFEGTCGDGLTWSFSGDTLTISGSGAMKDYSESNMAPWYSFRDRIAAVSLPEGLTRVGDLAFYDCAALQTVFLPDSVEEVGWHAFDGCAALTILDLGTGLRTIDDGAFKDCAALPALRLPGTLTTIGFQAFYRCESLAEITIPASVTELGMTAFAFCYQLIRADVQAKLTRLPDWTFYGCGRLATVVLPDTLAGANELAFYGCTNLANVIYTGSDANRAQIEADIQRDLDQTVNPPSLTEEEPETSVSTVVEESEDEIIVTDSSAAETENAAVSTDVTTTVPTDGSGSSTEAEVTVTLETAGGWQDVSGSVEEVVDGADNTVIDIYIKDDSTLSADALAALAGKNATVTVHTAAGAVWKIDCGTLETIGGCDLSYQRTDATEEQLVLMECSSGYQIRFLSSVQVNAEVMIRLPVDNAYRTATLFVDRDGLEAVQTVVVDTQGYAHFYLADVDSETVYLIGIDAPTQDAGNAIIPDTMYGEYGITDMSGRPEYVVTGRTSSWGLSFNQVTWIMVAVLGTVVIVVGGVMFALNKRKLKMGYVPDLDEEEE